MNEDSEKKDIDEDKSRKALFVQRLCAFIFDMLLVSLIASFITTPFLNSDKIHELEKKEQELIINIQSNDFKNNSFFLEYSDFFYQYSRSMGIVSIANILFKVLYFIVYQIYNNGQTIGKKIMKIKIVSDSGELLMNQMILRSMLNNFIFVDLSTFIFMLFSPKKYYMSLIGIVYFAHYLLLLVSIFMLIYRKDGRTIADRFVYTKVIRNN